MDTDTTKTELYLNVSILLFLVSRKWYSGSCWPHTTTVYKLTQSVKNVDFAGSSMKAQIPRTQWSCIHLFLVFFPLSFSLLFFFFSSSFFLFPFWFFSPLSLSFCISPLYYFTLLNLSFFSVLSSPFCLFFFFLVLSFCSFFLLTLCFNWSALFSFSECFLFSFGSLLYPFSFFFLFHLFFFPSFLFSLAFSLFPLVMD